MFPINDIAVLIVVLVIAWRLSERWTSRRDRLKREAATRSMTELGQAIQHQRTIAPPSPPAVNPDRIWEHIPRIAFDLDTQTEFGGSRYHTFYVSPDDDCVLDPGVYITDKYQGPRKLGESEQTRWFIPYDQLIKR